MSVSSLLQACTHLLLEMRLLGGRGGGRFQDGDEKHPAIPSAEARVPGDPLGPWPPEAALISRGLGPCTQPAMAWSGPMALLVLPCSPWMETQRQTAHPVFTFPLARTCPHRLCWFRVLGSETSPRSRGPWAWDMAA